jgi:hypothetical protein
VIGQAAAWVLLALVLALSAPLPLLLVAPLLFGVPHVAADLRHLVLDPPRRAHPRLGWWIAAPLGAMLALRAASLAGAAWWPRVELGLGLVAVGAGLALAGPGWSPARRLVAGATVLAAPLVWVWPGGAALVIGHAHNLVALGVWTLFAAWHGAGAGRWWVVGLTGIATGITLLWPAPAPGAAWGGLTLADLSAALAPGLAPEVAGRVVRSFALLQAVHYAMWLVSVPAARAEGGGARGWRQVFGSAGLAVVVLGSVLLPALGAVDPAGVRAAYLSLVLFHGWLELAVLASWTGRGAA